MDNEKVVVIALGGFLTSKKPKDVLDTDIIVSEGTESECNDIIQGKGRKKRI